MMKYPEGFAAKVRAALPGHPDVEKCLEHGSDILGRILDDSQVRFSPSEIIHALETGRTEELLIKAKSAQHIAELYWEWSELKYQELKAAKLRQER